MELKDRIKKLFIERAPNTISERLVYSILSDVETNMIDEELGDLVKGGFLLCREQSNVVVPDRIVKRYNLRLKDNLVVESEIDIGGIKIPRMIDGDPAQGEEMNTVAIQLSKLIDYSANRLQGSYQDEIKKYWGTIITLFGLFVAIFSIINITTKSLIATEHVSYWEVFKFSSMNVAPLAIVLMVFTYVLYRIFKK